MKLLVSALAATTLLPTTAALADGYPEKPITMVVAYSPGGGNDTVSRLMAKHIEPYLGTRMVVENHPGAGGQVGFTRLARADADGYTIGLLSSPSLFMIEMLRDGVAYSLDDFQAVANIQSDPILLAVNASSDYADLAALTDDIAANPGYVNVGGDGPQSNVHLQAAAFESVLELDTNFISYSGSGPTATALLGDEVDAALLSTSSALQFIEAGRIRPLAVFDNARHPALPDVPTLAEVAGAEVPSVGTAVRGVAGPAGIPQERLAHLESAFKQLLQDEEFQAAAANLGIVTHYLDSNDFTEMLEASREATAQYIDFMQ
ncbi:MULTISPECIES: tripartite tricarboxylate transporter substrate binding protein [unclassified Halomonas]|uniref:Bug family tripartite tricarboxylate transporter substrate binding protein n=1 Tax=unclassified Halomonas TaxID=2609666 RepID=UPI0028843BE6|nr:MULTISPECIES: tripartite tricarboxylate transporter substrate binding protein [unclassified Halomonas]MDT0501090.1 tripartite tricarboxylate transporter substrate binding protein [Halomonas sp. PAR7]MDT0513281.1 tripartite tricarboxylate transporter substrate binding protein [Halomonas sp. LES1]MDT0592206.1 tripartite tricarboxylate transporter substrate binding protein [Halomonas sp. PAR8]